MATTKQEAPKSDLDPREQAIQEMAKSVAADYNQAKEIAKAVFGRAEPTTSEVIGVAKRVYAYDKPEAQSTVAEELVDSAQIAKRGGLSVDAETVFWIFDENFDE